MPAAGIFHNLVFVSIDKQYPGQAYKVMHALVGAGTDVARQGARDRRQGRQRPRHADEVSGWRSTTSTRNATLEVVRGPVDVLDHASQHFSFGGKLGIDGTRKWPEEGFTREWPDPIVMDAGTKRRIDELWPRLGIRG